MNLLIYYKALCQDVAIKIYNTNPYSMKYTKTVSQFLFFIALKESDNFRASRQDGFSYQSSRGAFGFWQLQLNAIEEILKYLERKSTLRRRIAIWFFNAETNSDVDEYWFHKLQIKYLLQLLCADPRMCCLFARIYLLRLPQKIPSELNAMADYWGQHYNTRNDLSSKQDFICRATKSDSLLQRY